MADDAPTRILDNPIVLAAADGTGEVQKIDYTGVTAGKTTTLTFDGDTTAALAVKASLTAAEVQQALRDLETIPSDGVTVTGATGGPFTVIFNPEDWDNDNVPLLTAAAAEGAAPVVTVVSTGVSPEGPPAVEPGTTPNADARTRVSPLSKSSPAADRVANKGTYGDA